MLVEAGGKTFEKPEPDTYIGVIADVIDLGMLPKTYNGKTTIVRKNRIVWLLNKNDSTGQPLQVMEQFTASMSKTARFYERVKMILGHAPPAPYNADELIGLSRSVFVVREGEYAQIQGINPLKPGTVPMVIPAGYVRDTGQAAKKAAEKAQQAAPQAPPTQQPTQQLAQQPTQRPTQQLTQQPAQQVAQQPDAAF